MSSPMPASSCSKPAFFGNTAPPPPQVLVEWAGVAEWRWRQSEEGALTVTNSARWGSMGRVREGLEKPSSSSFPTDLAVPHAALAYFLPVQGWGQRRRQRFPEATCPESSALSGLVPILLSKVIAVGPACAGLTALKNGVRDMGFQNQAVLLVTLSCLKGS